MVDIINSLVQFTEFQVGKLRQNASHTHLSPLLNTTLLQFWCQWAPIYIHSNITTWSTEEASWSAIEFCISSAFHYCCYWPLELQVSEASCNVLNNLVKRHAKKEDFFKKIMIRVPAFQKLLESFCNAWLLTHSSSSTDCFKRINYCVRANLLTFILKACSNPND